MSEPKIVKRYSNRKLYDTERSTYVTLDDIAEMIRAGEEVRVIDNKSGEDLTSVTLAQIIFESEKKKNILSLSLLRDLIQNGGEQLTEFARQRVDRAKDGVLDIREQMQGRLHDIRDRTDTLRREFESKVKKDDGRLKILADLQSAIEETQRSVEDKLKGGVGVITREVDELRRRLADLENRLRKHD